jgi:hypothetical protein
MVDTCETYFHWNVYEMRSSGLTIANAPVAVEKIAFCAAASLYMLLVSVFQCARRTLVLISRVGKISCLCVCILKH